MKMDISLGVAGLLANAHSSSSFQGTRYFFKGDLCQMSTAQQVAGKLGIQTAIEGGLPFVMSKEDFDCVTQYLISNQMEGWWHYVTHEQFCEIKGEYYFNGKYMGLKPQIEQVAEELGIYIGKTKMSLLYATSKEDFNAIVEKLNIHAE